MQNYGGRWSNPLMSTPEGTGSPSLHGGRLSARDLSLLCAIDADLAHEFNSAEFQALYTATPPCTPPTDYFQPKEDWNANYGLLQAIGEEEQVSDADLEAMQRQLDILTRAKAKKDAKRGKEGEQDPNDPTDLLLAHGLNTLLKKAVGVIGMNRLPGIFVSFTDLTFKAHTYEGTNIIATNGSTLLQMLTFWRRHKTTEKYVLKDVTGSFRPGKATLILGPPRSGKSTLMKAIAGRLKETHHSKLQGVIEYAGLRLREKNRSDGHIRLVKLVGYIPQVDEHIPTLTVRETLEFSHSCIAEVTAKQLAKDQLGEREERELMLIDKWTVEITMALLGIRHVGDTVVGNEVLRGISGGQRKRLTTGEIMVSHTPVLMADEISTGLDSATAYDICNTLKAIARALNNTVVVSLLQPTPETYSIFDEVLVMAAGQIAYQGPQTEVLTYFEELGFYCPPAKDAAEFLQEVTLQRGIDKYRSSAQNNCDPYHIPHYQVYTPDDFGPAWQSSHLFRARLQEDVYWADKSKVEVENMPTSGFTYHQLTSRYTPSALRSIWLCLKRQTMLTLRNQEMTTGRVVQVIIGGLLLGSLYFQIPLEDFNAKYAVIFFAQLFVAIAGFAAIPSIVAEKQVTYRQTAAHFFHPLSYSIAANAIDIPISIIETIIFCSILYWMCGFSPVASDFFLFILTIILVKMAMGTMFRVVADVAPNEAIGQAIASIFVMVFVLHAGFFLAYDDMKPWWIWVYWINPLQYGMTSLSLIEFHSDHYSQLRDPANPSLGTWGDFYLSVKKIPTNDNRLYLGFIFNACFYAVMVVVDSIVLAFLRWPDKFPPQPPPPTEGIQMQLAKPMPFVPCTLSWKGINYDVDIPGKRGPSGKLGLRLLSNVSGFAKPNTMTALMGSSGAGKTTLLDVLAGRKNTGRVEGEILLNGQKADPVTFSRFAGYVEQMDIHSPSATVVEALRFSAVLRLPREVSAEDKEAYVWQVISVLNLLPIAKCPIGTRQNGLSVEQVKRVTIGVEMAANPAVMFLDEPTSGLDSMAADIVMDALKAVTKTGRTLVCTIHQPSSYLFAMFHHLLLLTRGGKTVFFGETGENSSDLVRYFNAIPGAPRHDGAQNPATWMLNVLNTEGIDFAEAFANSELAILCEEELKSLMQPTGEMLTSGHYYQAPVGTQLKALSHKWWLLHWRSPSYNLARFFTCLLIALIMGSIFFRITGTDQQSVFTQVGLQFMVFLFMGIIFANTLQGIISIERTVFYREKAAHMYYPFLLNVASGLCELPYVTFNILVFTAIFYWMIGLNPDVGLFFFWFFVFWLYVLFYTYLGLFLGCIMPTAEVATIIAGAITSLGSLLAGFMLPKYSIPWWWRWLYYMNPMTYALQPPLSTQFYCADAENDPANPGDCPTFTIQTIDGATVTVPIWVYVRDAFDLCYEDRWIYVAILICCILFARIGSALALMYVNHAKR